VTLTLDTTTAESVLLSAGYRILKPFVAGARTYRTETVGKVRVAAIVDLETTGTDVEQDEIVQLAIQRVQYDDVGVVSVAAPWVRYEQPSRPIPAEATKVHGITDAMVEGHCIDEFEVREQLQNVVLLIAHKADFDCPIFVRQLDAVPRFPWACSLTDVPWKARGYESARLGALLMDHTGHHFTGHDAGRDVAALAHVLATPFADGTSPFALMRASAAAPRVRILAVGAPFAAKDALKARGYQWEGVRRVWWTEVPMLAQNDESLWLASEIGIAGRCVPVDAMTRFLPWSAS
jgi:DNA polymerase-3 subunit epsilon